jgi:hypothetical protein
MVDVLLSKCFFFLSGKGAENALSNLTYPEYTKARCISRKCVQMWSLQDDQANREETPDGRTKTLLTLVHGLQLAPRQYVHNTIILQSAARQYVHNTIILQLAAPQYVHNTITLQLAARQYVHNTIILQLAARQYVHNTIILQLAARQYNYISNEFRSHSIPKLRKPPTVK